jgi:hypothetical protein
MKASRIWSDDTDSLIEQLALLREQIDGLATPLWVIVLLLAAQLGVTLARH